MVPPDYHWEKVQRILEGDDMTEKEIVQALRCCAEGLRETKFGLAPGPITRPPQSWRYVEEETWND